jgi:hypothetical protein
MEALRKKPIAEVHFQHLIWLNELTFYKEEIRIFEERLGDIAYKNLGNKELHVGVEQFQNKFLIHKNEIDYLKHDINENEKSAIESGKIHIRRIDYVASEEYLNLEDRMNVFRKLYNELKTDFYKFIVKHS